MTIKSRLTSLFAFALAALMVLPAVAFATTPVDDVNAKVSSGVTDATSVVTTNIPLILGVAVLFVLLKYGRRLIRAL